MSGFYGVMGKTERMALLNIKNSNNFVLNKYQISDIYLEQIKNDKFKNDKIFKENEKYFIMTDGVIVNSQDLMKAYNVNDLFEVLVTMYEEKGNDFFKDFRGSFSGLFYDKEKNKKIIYTSHFSEKQIYYSHTLDENLVFGSKIDYIANFFKRNNYDYTFNKQAAYFILSYGYMLDDVTMYKEIKKLNAGHYLLIENGSVKNIEYYKINNKSTCNPSEEEIINNIDTLFRKAIKGAFDKDKEYGYKHLVALSGGLDSRMTTWVANDMGYGNKIVNYTFSQSNYLDEEISKEIASDLKHEWIFKALDSGNFLKNIEKVVEISNGGVLAYGLSHVMDFFNVIDMNDFGIVHSGQVGGILKGYYNADDKVTMKGAYSTFLIDKVNYQNLKKYNNEAEFQFINRQLNGTLLGNLPIQEKTETLSPFLDVDFVDYCLSLPKKYRVNELFIKWMLSKYPDSANYIWESINGKITDKSINIMGRQIPLKQIPNKTKDLFVRKVLKKSPHISKHNMTPLDYWFNVNKDLRLYIDTYFIENIEILKFDKELQKDCENIYNKGNGTEKIQVLTLLAFLKLNFGDDNENKKFN